METPIKYKDVEINGRKFRVKKFSARVGSFMILKLTTILAPLFKNVKINVKALNTPDGNPIDDFNLVGFMETLGSISEQDFTYIQDACLRVCYELLPAGETQVLDNSGNFGVANIEDDTVAVMTLMAHALMFNLSGFFAESGLGSMVGRLISSQQN
ncbi:phage tail assembly chaperone [Brevibacillus panacihumi]|uniref:phage tail assembly chaperone n=1 Tax=Brevibacillus panacihumi TaxID=497735 RepID=UPI003D1F4EC4